jgi:hypothetical protein
MTPHSISALIHLGIQFERGDADVTAHRLAVNDRPARLPEPIDEMRAQRQEIEKEPVRAVSPRAIA